MPCGARADDLSLGTALESALSAADPGPVLRKALDAGLDPWLLAEGSRLSGRSDLSAKVGTLLGEAGAPLARYLGRTRGTAPGLDVWKAWMRARTALDAGDADAARAALKGVGVPDDLGPTPTVIAIEVVLARGEVLELARRPVEAVSLERAAGEAALALGWSENAEQALAQAMNAAYVASLYEEAWGAALGLRAVAEGQADTKRLADAEYNLGALAFQRGDTSECLRHLGEAEALYDAAGLVAANADVRSLRATVLTAVGDYRAALDEERALLRRPQDFTDALAQGENESRYGILLTRLGDLKGAEAAFQKAMDLAKDAHDEAAEAGVYGNRGVALRERGDWDGAILDYRKALALYESVGDAAQSAAARQNIGDAIAQAARAARDEALALPEGADRERRLREASARADEAVALAEGAVQVFEAAGAVGAALLARETALEAKSIFSKAPDFGDRFEAIRNAAIRIRIASVETAAGRGMVRWYVDRGAWNDALGAARRVAARLSGVGAALGDADAVRVRGSRVGVFELAIRAAAKLEDAEAMNEFLEAGRATALLRAMGGRSTLLRAAVPEALERDLETRRREKARAYAYYQAATERGARGPAQRAREAYRKASDDERDVMDQVDAIQGEAARRWLPPERQTLSALRDALRSERRGGGRVAYVALDLQHDQLRALVVTEDDARTVAYGPERTATLRKLLAAAEAAGEEGPAASTLDALRRLLLPPLALPAGVTRFVVVPDEGLSFLPPTALFPADCEVTFVPSGTTLVELEAQRRRVGKGVLALGGCDYSQSADPTVPTVRGGGFYDPLPGARAEVEAVTPGREDLRLLAEAATETGLESALTSRGPHYRWRSVHFACHGFVDVERPWLSALAVTPGQGEDGLLTAQEVSRLPLRTDLVVLSACETARGSYEAGEGVVGLVRACLLAGAPRVVASLWKVDDDATMLLMKAFYEAWRDGSSAAHALLEAQEAVRTHEETVVRKGADGIAHSEKVRPWAAPKYWAAWVLWGLPD